MNTTSIVLASTLVGAVVTGVHAQRADAPRSSQQQQTQGLRQATSARLTIPITGTLKTSETPATPTEPGTPPEAPPTTSDPTTPAQPSQTAAAATSTAETAATAVNAAEPAPQVTGTFSIRRFAQTTTGDVAAVGMLTLSLTDPTSGAARTIVTDAAMPVAGSSDGTSVSTPRSVTSLTTRSSIGLGNTATASTQECDTLSLTLGPVDLDLLGMGIRLDEANVEFVSRSAGRLGVVLCGANGVIDRGVSPSERMRVLNTLLDVVG